MGWKRWWVFGDGNGVGCGWGCWIMEAGFDNRVR